MVDLGTTARQRALALVSLGWAVEFETGIWQVLQAFCELGIENTNYELKAVFHLVITEG